MKYYKNIFSSRSSTVFFRNAVFEEVGQSYLLHDVRPSDNKNANRMSVISKYSDICVILC